MRDNWFAKNPAWIFLDEGLTEHEKIVFCAMGLFADTQNRCFPSVQRLANICSISRATAQRALAGLETKGVIHKKFRYEKNVQTSTLYSLAKRRYDPPEPPPSASQGGAPRLTQIPPPPLCEAPPASQGGTEQSQLTLPVNRASEQQNENARANFSEKEGEKNGDTRQREVQENDGRISTDVWQAFGKRRNG